MADCARVSARMMSFDGDEMQLLLCPMCAVFVVAVNGVRLALACSTGDRSAVMA